MSDAEAKLAAFWREDFPKVSDTAFRLAVLERRARRRFYLYTGWIVAGGVLAAGCVAVVAPYLPTLAAPQPVSGMIPFLSVVVTGACMLLAFTRTRQTF
jgi:hypothetical protein